MSFKDKGFDIGVKVMLEKKLSKKMQKKCYEDNDEVVRQGILAFDKAYVIESVSNNRYLVLQGVMGEWRYKRFELFVEPEETVFKVGDKVKVKRDWKRGIYRSNEANVSMGKLKFDEVYTVMKARTLDSGKRQTILFDVRGEWFISDRFELVTEYDQLGIGQRVCFMVDGRIVVGKIIFFTKNCSIQVEVVYQAFPYSLPRFTEIEESDIEVLEMQRVVK